VEGRWRSRDRCDRRSDGQYSLPILRMTHKPVTVAVVSWNTRDLLAKCLQSLTSDAAAGLADVWVVDNASEDGSDDLVRERFPWVHLIASRDNWGFGAAVNAVADQSCTEWIIPANADVAVAPGAIGRMIAEASCRPQVAAIAPRLVLPDGRTQHSVYPFPTVPFTLAYASGAVARSRRLARYWCIDQGFDPDEARQVHWAVGAFLLIRRTAWEDVGGFDKRQWMYAEDLDLGWRLHLAGWEVRYCPDAHVFHAESASTRQAWGDDRHTRWHTSTYVWHARRRGAWIARTIAGVNIAAYTARAAFAGLRLNPQVDRLESRRAALNSARAHRAGLRSAAVSIRLSQSDAPPSSFETPQWRNAQLEKSGELTDSPGRL
jgi:N-acetylglucosaminyl-diphospho-decaprenol L-rhamnosyltransferase